MYSHNGNLTSLFHAVICFGPFGIFRESGSGRVLSPNGPYMPNLGPIRVGTTAFKHRWDGILVTLRFSGLLLRFVKPVENNGYPI